MGEIDILNAHNRKLVSALKQAVRVIMQWHGLEVFDVYFNNAPEMKQIREVCTLHQIKKD